MKASCISRSVSADTSEGSTTMPFVSSSADSASIEANRDATSISVSPWERVGVRACGESIVNPSSPIPSPRGRRAESGFDFVFFEAFHLVIRHVGGQIASVSPQRNKLRLVSTDFSLLKVDCSDQWAGSLQQGG